VDFGVLNFLPGLALWIIAIALFAMRGRPRETWRKYGLAWFWSNSSSVSLVAPLMFFVAGALYIFLGAYHAGL
jgi:hypothetical protein